jgi:hypothetical protein
MHQTMRLRILINGLLLLLNAFGSGCKQIDLTPGLPEETQEGKNTFGCMVNDQVWLPYVEHTLDRKVEAEYRGGYFTLRAEREMNPLEYIRLQMFDSAGLQLKTYTLWQQFSGSYESIKNGTPDMHVVDSTAQGSITFTKVEPKTKTVGNITSHYHIISGRFSFTAKSLTTGNRVTLKEGRFDVQAF